MFNFWKRDRIAHGLVEETAVDLQSLCEAARLTVEKLPALERENEQLRDRISDAEKERRGALSDRDRLRAELKEVEGRLRAELAISTESGFKLSEANMHAAAIAVERDAALAEVKRLRDAYEDIAGGLAVMMDVALGVVETFPDEAQPESEATEP